MTTPSSPNTSTRMIPRTTCRGCESRKLETILDLGPQPLAGAFLSGTADIAAERRFALVVHACEACALVQILNPVDPEILFQDYSFSSSTIKPLIDHFTAYAKLLNEKFHPKGVVEFGCNDGILLGPLQALGINSLGVDISQNITALARAKGLDARAGYFDEHMANAIRETWGSADIVTGSNAFAHNDHPEDILKAAAIALNKDGVLALEVMYAGDLREQLQWDTLYHEHLTFYSLTALSGLLRRYGFHIFDAQRIPMHGGSLRVFASKNLRGVEAGADEIFKQEADEGLAHIDTWRGFSAETNRKIEIVKATFSALAQKYSIYGYGAAGKATMWVNACEMVYLKGMIDASPLRAGKLMPGTHTPIVFPEQLKSDPPDYIFVTAWNYAEVIRAKEAWFRGIWSTPLPTLRFF